MSRCCRCCPFRKFVKIMAWIDLLGTLVQMLMLATTFNLLYYKNEENDENEKLFLSWVISEDVKRHSEDMPWMLPYVVTVDSFCNVIQFFAAIALIIATNKNAPPGRSLSLTIFFGAVTIVIGFIFVYLLGIDSKRYLQVGFTVQLIPIVGLLIVHPFAMELSERVKSVEGSLEQQPNIEILEISPEVGPV